jgi:serine/threonine protein kinase
MIGQTLKHYKIEELLGMGGMGVVYRARDTKLQRPVALKILKPELVADPGRKSRFIIEAQAAAAVSHPAIASIYDIDEADGTMFIAMEYIEGRTVGRLIAEGELDLQGAVEIGHQVSEGLAKAHEAKIVHRDIKSDNIMVTRDGHAKLLDFGLAKLLDTGPVEDAVPAEVSRTLTRERVQTIAGTVMGTTNYMSPEQARGRSVDSRSDIFSLGVVLYEMVTGELPFSRETALDTMHAIVFEEAKPVTAVRPNLPAPIHQIISRCLRKRPEDRYPDAGRLADDLKRLEQSLESGTSLVLPPGERIKVWLETVKTSVPLGNKGLIILAAVLIVAFALLFTRVQWGSFIGPAFLALFLYRFFRNRRRRLLSDLAKKISKSPEVKVVLIQEDKVTVVLDRGSAKSYLRIHSKVDALNSSLFFGKPVTVDIKDELAEAELKKLVRQPGVSYIRDDVEPE